MPLKGNELVLQEDCNGVGPVSIRLYAQDRDLCSPHSLEDCILRKETLELLVELGDDFLDIPPTLWVGGEDPYGLSWGRNQRKVHYVFREPPKDGDQDVNVWARCRAPTQFSGNSCLVPYATIKQALAERLKKNAQDAMTKTPIPSSRSRREPLRYTDQSMLNRGKTVDEKDDNGGGGKLPVPRTHEEPSSEEAENVGGDGVGQRRGRVTSKGPAPRSILGDPGLGEKKASGDKIASIDHPLFQMDQSLPSDAVPDYFQTMWKTHGIEVKGVLPGIDEESEDEDEEQQGAKRQCHDRGGSSAIKPKGVAKGYRLSWAAKMSMKENHLGIIEDIVDEHVGALEEIMATSDLPFGSDWTEKGDHVPDESDWTVVTLEERRAQLQKELGSIDKHLADWKRYSDRRKAKASAAGGGDDIGGDDLADNPLVKAIRSHKYPAGGTLRTWVECDILAEPPLQPGVRQAVKADVDPPCYNDQGQRVKYFPTRAELYRNAYATYGHHRSMCDLFWHFWPSELNDLIIRSTNARLETARAQLDPGSHTSAKHYEDIDLSDLFLWFGFRIGFVLQRLNNENEYWAKPPRREDQPGYYEKCNLQVPIQGTVKFPDFSRWGMLHRRFQIIDNYLATEDPHNPHVDISSKIWRVQRMVDLINDSCKQVMANIGGPGEFIAVDETMIRYTGKRCNIARVMPNKPIGRGIKMFMAVDHDTGMVASFAIDHGQYAADEHSHLPYGASGQVVIDLVRPYASCWRTVITDCWYTSVALALFLLSLCIYLIGELHVNRGVPLALRYPKKPTKGGPVKRGEYSIYKLSGGPTEGAQADEVEDGGPVYLIAWMDAAANYIIDTRFGARYAEVKRKVGKGTRYKEVDRSTTKAFEVYGIAMGAVDHHNQTSRGVHSVSQQGRDARSDRRVVEAMMDLTFTNALHLHHAIRKHQGMYCMYSHRDFLIALQRSFFHHAWYIKGLKPREPPMCLLPPIPQAEAVVGPIRHCLLEGPSTQKMRNGEPVMERISKPCVMCWYSDGRHAKTTVLYCPACSKPDMFVYYHAVCYFRFKEHGGNQLWHPKAKAKPAPGTGKRGTGKKQQPGDGSADDDDMSV